MDGSSFKVDVSVIVPTYCPGAYIWECLDSLAKQTCDKNRYEVIIVLNGCSEPYLGGLTGYIEMQQDTNFRLIHTDEPGVSNARNLGLDAVQGEYILFVDDDDYVSSDYVKQMLRTAVRGHMPVCRKIDFEEGTPPQDVEKSLGWYIPGTVLGKLRMTSCFNHPVRKLVPLAVIGGRRFDKKFDIGEDCLFFFQISDRIGNLEITPDTVIYYRRLRNGSAIHRKRSLREFTVKSMGLMWAYLEIWFRHPLRYNFPFVVSRIFAELWFVVGIWLRCLTLKR